MKRKTENGGASRTRPAKQQRGDAKSDAGRKVEVVRFLDPSKRRFLAIQDDPSRKHFMSSKVADVHNRKAVRTTSDDDSDDDEQLRLDIRDIEALGASALTGKEKKEYEARRMMSLGAKAPKPIRTPYPILMGMKKAENRRQARKLEEDLAAGNRVLRPSKASRQKAKLKSKDRGLGELSVGRFARGVLHVPDSLRRKVEAKPKGAGKKSTKGRRRF